MLFIEYVVSTTAKFRLIFNNHKSRLRAHSKMWVVYKESDDLVNRHFRGHHGLLDVSIQLIDKVNAKDDLLAKKGLWVYWLRSLKPDGLNAEKTRRSSYVFLNM